MAGDKPKMPVCVDFTPNQAKEPLLAEDLRTSLHQHLDDEIDGILARQSQLPILIVHDSGEYVQLLVEARDLYCHGFFYACVAMCGIVSERIIKDILRAALRIQTVAGTSGVSEEALDQLERVEVAALTQFVAACGIISKNTRIVAAKLVELRNKYAHARGKNPQSDAI